MKLLPTLLSVVLACTCATAFAQWQWIDKDGRKVFSDRAPPADILDKNILKRPAGRGVSTPTPVAEASEAAAPNAPAAPAAGAGPKTSGVDKELEAKKKLAADAELAKKKAEEERITKAKIENCARAKQAKATFDSGVRMSRTNAKGEREIMDDAAREAEGKRIHAIITADCQ
ncbi:DUF4124 domain-containing protein [Rhodoferax saidenbachensis]|uniref:DUF4124 domain-containing protein n=1 Tax=Rhodoferax saidenbachensis TaxID=1484693 RepID=A0A1P8KFM4_9BURK|nr:DUF4124 domain-containing protein [Rhodoferax saidenbachensis]APW44799.1 DUF4124 domain-containing protein [Rhodoferax saidenbachensis]